MSKYIIIFLVVSGLSNTYSDSLSIVFLGDTYLGKNYRFSDLEQNPIDEFGYEFFFENVKDLLLSSDLVFANLESVLSNGGLKTAVNEKYIHYSDPDSIPFYLSKYNISAVTLANNHILDLGIAGLENTINSLSNYKISSFGIGLDEENALKPFNKKFSNGDKEFDLYVFGAYWYRTRFDIEKNYYAKGGNGGVNELNPEKITSEIKKIKQSNPNAYVIIYPHWGSNYKQRNEYQKEIAHRLIEGGADLIIGHGAHTVQEIENYNNKWIIYNIGNFIFNAPGRYRSTKAKPYGLTVRLAMKGSDKFLRIYPVYTNNLESDCQLRFLNKEEFDDCSKIFPPNSSVSKKGSKFFQINLN